MNTRREPHEIDLLLQDVPVTCAPEAIWDRVQEELASPAPAPRALVKGRPVASRVLMAASIVFALIGGSVVGVFRTYRAPAQWDVAVLRGEPTLAGVASLEEGATLQEGDWLVTDSTSEARISVGRIGTATVGPNSRVRLDEGRGTEHRLTLEEGSVYAFIDAPPRLFFVETPVALATDLGCAYTLEVDGDGVTRIHVTSGWVELGRGENFALVAAGLIAEVGSEGIVGTPYPQTLPDSARAALGRLDEGSRAEQDLRTVLSSLYPEGMPVNTRQPTMITLWHLLQRVDEPLRSEVVEALATLSPLPSDVTTEGILALDRPMLERWRRDLLPMWAEEDVSWIVRTGRRIWEWTVR